MRRRDAITILTLVLAIPLLGPVATAAPAGARAWSPEVTSNRGKRGHHRGRGRRDVTIIRDYYSTRRLPPGLAKRRALPPGLRRQLIVGGHLPPGLEKRLYPIPRDLAARLPRLPEHHRRLFLGVDLLIVDTRHNVVVEVVADVLR